MNIIDFSKICIDDKLLFDYAKSETNLQNINILRHKILTIKSINKALPIKVCFHPCSGKTFFTNYFNANYKNIRLYDFDRYIFNDPRRSRDIFNNISLHNHSCLFGCYEKPNIDDNIIDTSIVISYKSLKQNYTSRISSTINHGWDNLDRILDSRLNLITNSINNNIPIFTNILEFLEFIVNTWNEDRII